MKTRSILVLLSLFLLAVTAAFAADDPFMGTWKLNESKSKLPAGMAKNSTVTYTAEGDQVKVTIDGTTADGKPLHNEWVGKYDGKDYPVTGDATESTRSVKKVNDRTLDFTVKTGDKTTATGKVVVAKDGKTRTVTTTGTDSKGKKMTSTTVYDKE
jgi:hypothetical protein